MCVTGHCSMFGAVSVCHWPLQYVWCSRCVSLATAVCLVQYLCVTGHCSISYSKPLVLHCCRNHVKQNVKYRKMNIVHCKKYIQLHYTSGSVCAGVTGQGL